MVCFGQWDVSGYEVSKGFKCACATELAIPHTCLSPWYKHALVVISPSGIKDTWYRPKPNSQLEPTSPTESSLGQPDLTQSTDMWEGSKYLLPYASGFWGGLLCSNIMAIDDWEICPGKFEEWEEVLQKVLHLVLHMAHNRGQTDPMAAPHPSSRFTK